MHAAEIQAKRITERDAARLTNVNWRVDWT